MIAQMLKRTIVAEKTAAHLCQIICSLTGGLVLVLGIRKLAALDLGGAQLLIATLGTVLLSGVFIILAFLCRAWRRSLS